MNRKTIQEPYEAPKCEIIEMQQEGVLCGSSAIFEGAALQRDIYIAFYPYENAGYISHSSIRLPSMVTSGPESPTASS